MHPFCNPGPHLEPSQSGRNFPALQNGRDSVSLHQTPVASSDVLALQIPWGGGGGGGGRGSLSFSSAAGIS